MSTEVTRLKDGPPGAEDSKWRDPLTRRRCQVMKSGNHGGGLCTNAATLLIRKSVGQIRFYYTCRVHQRLHGNADDDLDMLFSIRPGY